MKPWRACRNTGSHCWRSASPPKRWRTDRPAARAAEQDLDTALAGTLGEAWRPLWLGVDTQGRAAGIVSLQGLASPMLMADAAEDLEGVQLVDRIGELNRLFAATQLSAAELKLASCLAILLLLCIPFGFGGSLRIVALPLLAALAALASLGWLGQPLTLFSLFGLLLVTAIGVDYAILMREAIGGAAVSLLGTLLSGLTSWLSFGLLLLSQTPAIANFGLTISLGLFFCFLLAPGRSRATAGQGSAGMSVVVFWIGLLALFALATWLGRRLGLIPIVSQLLLASFGLPLVMLWLAAPVGLDNAQVLAAPWLKPLYGVAFTLLLGHILSDDRPAPGSGQREDRPAELLPAVLLRPGLCPLAAARRRPALGHRRGPAVRPDGDPGAVPLPAPPGLRRGVHPPTAAGGDPDGPDVLEHLRAWPRAAPRPAPCSGRCWPPCCPWRCTWRGCGRRWPTAWPSSRCC